MSCMELDRLNIIIRLPVCVNVCAILKKNRPMRPHLNTIIFTKFGMYYLDRG